ncbi:MAG TPA: hypothetical protein VEL74_21410, partial [Thermoanaerobaculia bacterium]|nr:hypothetical protein [Thermoanaerobaculia bacterium]
MKPSLHKTPERQPAGNHAGLPSEAAAPGAGPRRVSPSNPASVVERWALRLAAAAIARPRLAVILALVVVLAAAPGLLRLELRTDGR